MRILVGVAFAALIAIGAPAFADDHWQSCGPGFEAGAEISLNQRVLKSALVGGRKELCYDTNGTADSPLLNVASCDQVDIKLYNLTDGAPETNLSVIPRACPSATDQENSAGIQATSTTTCEPIVADLSSATNQEALGYGGSYLFIDMVTNTNSDAVRVMVRCNGG